MNDYSNGGWVPNESPVWLSPRRVPDLLGRRQRGPDAMLPCRTSHADIRLRQARRTHRATRADVVSWAIGAVLLLIMAVLVLRGWFKS